MDYKGFNNIPTFYEFNNLYNGMIDPSTVHTNSTLKAYFMKYLLEKIISVYEFKNIPKEWNTAYFNYVLFCFGFIAVLNTDRYGVIPQHCTLNGRGIFYQPTRALVSNPLLNKSYNLLIGSECELIKLQPNYSGVMDIVSYYADMLALSSESASANLINTKLAYVFAVDDSDGKGKARAETFKKMFDAIQTNNPMSIIDKSLFNEDGSPNWIMFNQNLKQSYIANDIILDMAKWMDMFNSEIGIPNANTEKKERMLTDEVNANNVDTMSKATLWLECIRECLEKVNNLFNLNITCDFRFKKDMEVDYYGK